MEKSQNYFDLLDDALVQLMCQQLETDLDFQTLNYLVQTSRRIKRLCQPNLDHSFFYVYQSSVVSDDLKDINVRFVYDRSAIIFFERISRLLWHHITSILTKLPSLNSIKRNQAGLISRLVIFLEYKFPRTDHLRFIRANDKAKHLFENLLRVCDRTDLMEDKFIIDRLSFFFTKLYWFLLIPSNEINPPHEGTIMIDRDYCLKVSKTSPPLQTIIVKYHLDQIPVSIPVNLSHR